MLLALNSHYGNNLPTRALGKFGLGLKARVLERASGESWRPDALLLPIVSRHSAIVARAQNGQGPC